MKDAMTIEWFDPEAVKPSENTQFLAINKTDDLCYGVNVTDDGEKLYKCARLNRHSIAAVFSLAGDRAFEKEFKKWGCL